MVRDDGPSSAHHLDQRLLHQLRSPGGGGEGGQPVAQHAQFLGPERLAQQDAAMAALQGPNALLKEEVTADEIADIVSKWTGIPVSKMLEGEKEKLLQMN